MARPTKFRHPLDDLTKPHLASQIAGYVSEIELYRKKVEELQTQIAQVYDDMDEEGFDKAIVRKLVAKRAKGEKADAEAEAIEAYEIAAEKGFSSRARVEIEKSYPERVSRPVQSRPGAEAGSAVRSGAPVSQITAPGFPPSVQIEGEAGERPEEAASAVAAGISGVVIPAEDAEFVAQAGSGEALPGADEPAPAADEPIKGLAEANAIATRAIQPAPERATHAADIDLTIPAFLRRTKPEHHHSFGEQA